jgi:hypothetical protein
MLKALKTLGLALVLSAISSVGSVAALNGDDRCVDRLDPFLLDFVVESYTKSTGALTLKVTITYCPETPNKATCDLLTLSVYPVGGLTYTGEDTLQIPYRGGNPTSVLFEVTVPPNDTSCLAILWECSGHAQWDGQVFLTTGDTLVTFRGNGSYWRGPAIERSLQFMEPYLQQDYERAKREWEAQQESLKLLYPPEGKGTLHGPRFSPEDSALASTLSEKGKQRLAKMRNLERAPLTDYPSEIISLDGTMYVRYRGETKFHKVEGTTDPVAHGKKVIDSIRIAEGKEYDLTIDLRDPDNYELIKNLVDTLMPTDQPGFFRAMVKWNIIMELRDQGIEFYKTQEGPPKPRDTGWTTDEYVPMPFTWVLEPKVHPHRAGPVDMMFSFVPTEHCAGCNKATVTVTTKKGLEYLGPSSWTVQVDSANPYSTVLHIILPPNDTSSIHVRMQSGGLYAIADRYFVTTGDSVEFWKGYPEKGAWDDFYLPEPDTTRYEVRIDLRNTKRYEYIRDQEDLFGPLQPTNDSGFYSIRITRELFNDLKMEGFECEYLEEPPPMKPGRPGVGTFKRIRPEPDSTRQRCRGETKFHVVEK